MNEYECRYFWEPTELEKFAQDLKKSGTSDYVLFYFNEPTDLSQLKE